MKLNCNDEDIIMIHDAARPFFTDEMIVRLINKLNEGYDAVFPALKIHEAVKQIIEGRVNSLNRNEILIAQTPQCMRFKHAKEIYKNLQKEYLDDIEIASAQGLKVGFVEGESTNKKITFKQDLYAANY